MSLNQTQARRAQPTSKARSRSWDCAVCGKPIRKGASLELREWTRCEGFKTDEQGNRGLIKGVGIVLFTHSRCSTALKEERGVVRRLDEKLRAMSAHNNGGIVRETAHSEV